MGPVELQLGKAYAALRRLDQAAEDLDTAIALSAANGARGCAVEASVELAAVLLRRQASGDLDRAWTLLDHTAGEAARLGMAPFITRIADLRGDPAQSPLSRREQEVVELVRQGLTNRQIAERLFVSERTAENHVQHILTKLGLSNRTQIAAWAPMK